MGPRIEMKKARTKAGLTETELANRVGVKISYICHIEANRKTPSPKIMGRIAKELNVPAANLFWELAGQADGGDKVAAS